MEMETSTSSLPPRATDREQEEIKPYRIHVSKLTRLPHELLLPREREWEYGTPKREIEPLVDFWLEQYSWRIQETHLNSTLPQFRTTFSPPKPETNTDTQSAPLRIHFIHIRSSHKDAIPLLLVPTFPLTNLSLAALFKELSEPPIATPNVEDGGQKQAFHLVVPSIPGMGFSDAFASPEAEGNVLEHTARLFDALMKRLGYEYYLTSATGCGRDSPGGIDYFLPRLIGEMFPSRCLGTHLLEPCVERPQLRIGREGVLWVKWKMAGFFKAGVWGYGGEDWKALGELERRRLEAVRNGPKGERSPLPPLNKREARGYGAVGMVGLREPNTFAYALCDSPVGLLSMVCSALRRKSPKHELSNTNIIDVAQLAWLPGPEGGARFWAAAVKEVEELEWRKDVRRRARVAVTVFGVDGLEEEGYSCPAWAEGKHDVVFAQRAEGKAGLVAWERTDVVVAGIRGLAQEVLKVDRRLKTRPLEEVVVGEDAIPEVVEEDSPDHGLQLDVESPDTVVALSVR